MKRHRIKVGAILIIPLADNKFGYGRILEKSSVAIYDYVSYVVQNDIGEIIEKPILFIIAVYDDVIKSGRWKIIGHKELENNLKRLPLKFIQDELKPEKFSLYDPNTGNISRTEKENCYGLERSAVWDALHVEERIMDYINGKPNYWVEHFKIPN